MTPFVRRTLALGTALVVVALLLVPVSTIGLGGLPSTRLVSLGAQLGASSALNSPRTIAGTSNLSFVETGLPGGTAWGVSLSAEPRNGSHTQFASSNTTVVSFAVATGKYGFLVPNATTASALYLASPSNSTVTVNTATVTVNITFRLVPLYALEFSESGLPNGTSWEVRLTNASIGTYNGASNSTTLALDVPAGVYQYWVESSPSANVFYTASPANGSVTIPAVGSIAVTFTLETSYTVSFAERGLPSGSVWYTGVNWTTNGVYRGEGEDTANATISFQLPNGTYHYLIEGPLHYRLKSPAPAGMILVNGTSLLENVTFTGGKTFVLTFAEKGLSSGQKWCVETSGLTLCTTGKSEEFADLTPGAYTYAVISPFVGQTITGKVGKETVALTEGVPQELNLTKSTTVALLFAYPFTITFAQVGLTAGTWSVTIRGHTETASWNGSIQFSLTNGTYAYQVGPQVGYKQAGSPTKVVVPTSVSVTVTFTKRS